MIHYYKLFEIIKADNNTDMVYFNIVDEEIIKDLKIKTTRFKKVFDFVNNCWYIAAKKQFIPKCTICGPNRLAEYAELTIRNKKSYYCTYLCRSCFDTTRGDLSEEDMLEL